MDLQDLKDLLQKQGNAFEEFKATNDQLIKAKADGKSVESLEAKLAKIDAELGKIADVKSEIEALERAINPPGGPGEADKAKAEHKAAFQKFMRKGDDSNLGDLQRKAYNITTDADGAYAVPEEIDRDILAKLIDVSPIRQIATVRAIGTSDYKKRVTRAPATREPVQHPRHRVRMGG